MNSFRIKFIIFILLLLVSCVFSQTILPYIIILILILLEIISIIMAFFVRNTIKIKLTSDSTCNVNQNCETTINIYSKYIVMFAKAVVTIVNPFNNEKNNQIIYFSKGLINKEVILKTNIKSKYCGNLEIIINNIKIYDLFRLFGIKCNNSEKIRTVILPNIFKLGLSSFNGNINDLDSDEYSQDTIGQDISSVFDYREYKEGDPIHQINWKLSQKWNKLIIKELSLPIGYKVVILLDNCINKNTSHDLLLKFINAQAQIVMSLSKSLIENDIPHKIMWYSEQNYEWCQEQVKSDNDFFPVFSRVLSVSHFASDINTLARIVDDGLPNQITHLFNIQSDFQNNENITEILRDKINIISFVPSENDESYDSNNIIFKCDNPQDTLEKVVL